MERSIVTERECFVDPTQSAVLKAAIDRIIPADDFPSASEAGVMNYLDRILAHDAADFVPALHEGLAKLELSAQNAYGHGFAVLSPDDQDGLLRAIENTPFFQRLVRLTSEGFYADPANGGNKDGVSWRMIGYKPDPV